MKRAQTAYTLIEMLVVIVIISILAGLVLSVAWSAYRAALRGRCWVQFCRGGGGGQCSADFRCQTGRPPGWTEASATERFRSNISRYKYTPDGHLFIECKEGFRSIRESKPD